MIVSHVAWLFVALLLGVCIGWLSYKRGRGLFAAAIIWIVAGLVIVSPALLPNVSAAATPLGTLLALFYFVGCPLGWSLRQDAFVHRGPAERAAPGYVFRGRTTPPRWQLLRQQAYGAAPADVALRGDVAPTPAAGLNVSTPVAPTDASAARDESAAPPAGATAHAAPGDGKTPTPIAPTTAIGANAGVATAPAAAATIGTRTVPIGKGLAHGTEPTKSEAAPPVPAPPASSAPLAAHKPDNAAGKSHDDPAEVPSGATSSAATHAAGLVVPGETADAADPATGRNAPTAATPTGTAPAQSRQASLDLTPAVTVVAPQTTPSAAPAADPPASAPVPDQDKHPGTRPAGFVTARADRPDDLQLIRGIGPQNEGRLHGLGIWHFDQIGAWTPEEVRWVGSYLAFPGRIDREKWVEQAQSIAVGAIAPKVTQRRPARPR